MLSIVGVLVMIILYMKTKNYQKEYVKQLSSKEHPLRMLYPMCLFLLSGTRLYSILQKKKEEKEMLKQLHIGENISDVQILYWCKKLSILFVIFFGSMVMLFLLEVTGERVKNIQNNRYLERQAVGEGSRQVTVAVDTDGKEQEEVEIAIPEQNYTERELSKKMEQAKCYVQEHYLGKNKNEQEIYTALNLMNTIPDSAIFVRWNSWNDSVIEENGVLHNASLKNVESCELTATLVYGETTEEMNFSVLVHPTETMTQEEWKNAINETMEEVSQKNGSDKKIELPKTIYGKQVTYTEPQKKSFGGMLLLFTILMAVLLWNSFSQDLKKKVGKREEEMLVDYPELVNKFTLLLSAGMTVSAAWGKIATEYRKKREEGKKEKRFAYEEWGQTWTEMTNGVTEMVAFEHFGQRAKLMPYLKFSTLLGQNLRKGSKGLVEILEYEAMDAFENRKQMTKRLAEEAGTKLLAPMMIMLILVLLIIMAPAFQSI